MFNVIKKNKNMITSHFITFVVLNVICGISLHFIPDPYKYAPFYAAGLGQEYIANFIKNKLFKNKE